MRIEREATNSFTLAARPTVSPSRWLLRFNRENDPATEQLCIATALATTGMPVLLTFEEVDSSPDPQAGEVTLSTGQWRLRVYEQTTTSLNYANSTRSVYDVLVEVVGAEIPDPDPTDPCEGDGGDCPEDCEVIEGMDASEIVACVPSADRPALLCEVMDTAEATPEAIVVCLDGANKTDAVKAIICNPCPECDPLDVVVNDEAYATVEDPCGGTTNVRVLDADDNPVGKLDAPDWRIPSATVQLKDSAGDDIGSADSYLPGANTTKTAPDGSVQRQDSVGANIGTPIAVRSNQTGLAVTCPDGTVTINNSVPTLLHTVAVKSNGSAVQAIADSTITKPDGTTVGLPATVALDVRDYRSGIAYQFGMILHYGNSTSYRTGDEGDMYANGFFDYTRPVYPTHYAELVNNTTLVSNNIHGNTNRFTDRDGNQTYSDDIVQDHFQGVEIYRVLQSAANWNGAIDGAVALSLGGDSDWRLTPARILLTVMNGAAGAGANFLNFAPFSISNTNYWTSTTQAFSTANAFRVASGTVVTIAKTNTYAWLACRRFI